MVTTCLYRTLIGQNIAAYRPIYLNIMPFIEGNWCPLIHTSGAHSCKQETSYQYSRYF